MLKWPPGLIGAESQTIGSSDEMETDSAEIMAKKMLLPGRENDGEKIATDWSMKKILVAH